MKYALIVIVLLSVVPQPHAADDSTVAVSKTWFDRIEQVMNKSGVLIGGELDAGHFGSKISGTSDDGINPNGRRTEADEFTSIDFDIRLRPHDAIEGRAILRLHHNWQNFWSDPGNPIFSRWISIDGKIARMLPFHVNDFTAQFTPLTLYMPEVDILYEPEIFARLRKNAMKDFFLGDNNRPLQGATIGIDNVFEPIFDKCRMDLIGTRLRSVETSTLNGSRVVSNSEAAPDFSKYFVGTNFEMQLLKDITSGGTWLRIADLKNSLKRSAGRTVDDAQRTDVVDFRAGYDIAPLLGWSSHEVRLFGEAAFSFDDTKTTGITHDRVPGCAGYGGIEMTLGFLRDLECVADVRYICNKKDFRNELAQSPSFLGTRIMNIESDKVESRQFTANHYSTFDALYHHVFKFCPSQITNLWDEAPFTKSSYANNVYTRGELDSIRHYQLDPAVQLIMPFGPATPDRQGIRMHYTASWESKGLELRALYSFLTGERQPALKLPDETMCKFREIGGGLSFDASKALRLLKYPLVVSGSFMRNGKANGDTTITSDFSNFGVRWQLLRRIMISSGIQRIVGCYNKHEQLRQTYLLAGGSLMITRGVDFHGTVGRLTVDNDADAGFDNSPHQTTFGKFKQVISEVSLKVVF